MRSLKSLFLFAIVLIVLQNNVIGQKLTYKPGAGIKLSNEKEEWSLRLLGYIQSTFTYHQQHENNTVQDAFFVRRARVDLIFDYLKKYQMFFEFDGRGSRTELVLAQVDVKYYKNNKIRVGKFITPFSPENNRSSRSLSTVERYAGLNSMFLLPGLDTQYGIMLLGSSNSLEYYLSVTNGNGKASQNLKENNDAKDFQGRIRFKTGDNLKLGLALNYAKEEAQVLKLADHTFSNFNEASVNGKRFGYLAEFEYINKSFMFRGEGFQYHFLDELSAANQIKRLIGGYLELGYFLSGNTSNGIQLVGRYETSQYAEYATQIAGPTNLNTFLIGTNFYKDGIFRLQVDLVYDKANENSGLTGRLYGKDSALQLLTMLQIKF